MSTADGAVTYVPLMSSGGVLGGDLGGLGEL